MKRKNTLLSLALISAITSTHLCQNTTIMLANEPVIDLDDNNSNISDESSETVNSDQSNSLDSIDADSNSLVQDEISAAESSSEEAARIDDQSEPEQEAAFFNNENNKDDSDGSQELVLDSNVKDDNIHNSDENKTDSEHSDEEILLDESYKTEDTASPSFESENLENQSLNMIETENNSDPSKADENPDQNTNELILTSPSNAADLTDHENPSDSEADLNSKSADEPESREDLPNEDKPDVEIYKPEDFNIQNNSDQKLPADTRQNDSVNLYNAKLIPSFEENQYYSESRFYSSRTLNPLPETLMKSDTWQVINKKQNGIYFADENQLNFYSFKDGSTSLVFAPHHYSEFYSTGDKIYYFTNDYSDASKITVSRINLNTKKLESSFIMTCKGNDQFGVDDSGRIYVSTCEYSNNQDIYKIQLFDSSGKYLSSVKVDTRVMRFAGFDQSTGTFYYECYYNWVYWGYDHDMRASGYGKVKNNQITYADYRYFYDQNSKEKDTVDLIGQSYWYDRERMFEDIGGGYMAIDSTFTDQIKILKKNALNHNRQTLPVVSTITRDNMLDKSFDSSPTGVRAIYNSAHQSVLTAVSSNYLWEIDPASNKVICSIQAKYPILSVLTIDETIYLIEKNGSKYYLEKLRDQQETRITISAAKTTLLQGESIQLKASGNGDHTYAHEWSTSNPTVISVDQSGTISAYLPGTATVTVKNSLGIKDTVQITVKEKSLKAGSARLLNDALKTYNKSLNDYNPWSKPVESYLNQNSNGTFTRAQWIYDANGNYLLVESYSASFKKTGSKKIKDGLPILGGVFHGKDKNYVVTGQLNTSQSNSLPCVRVVQYSHNWAKEKTLDISNINTYIPFDAGSCRFTETDNSLYIYTCHEMYDNDGDGIHHQANMIFEVNKSDFKVKQSYTDVMNIAQAGYVSHSFNQFIQTDGNYLYRVDHGDANPRAVSIVASPVAGKIDKVSYTYAYEIADTDYFYNYTGVSVGGMELSNDSILIALNSINMVKKDAQRNILVTITDKSSFKTKTIWLTNYASDAGVTVKTPQMVKLNNSHFMILWEESTDNSYYNNTAKTKAVVIDGSGNRCSSIFTYDIRLSDCQPIYCSDGLVRWYSGDFESCTLYALQPYNQAKNKDLSDESLSAAALNAVKLSVYGPSLSWSKVYGADGYNVYRSTSKNGTYTYLKSVTGGKLYWTDTSASSGKTYYYKVRPYKKLDGTTFSGSYSSPKALYIRNSPSLSISPKSGVTISLSWNKASNAGGYEIWCSTNGTNYSKIKAVGASQTSTSHTNLSAGKLYYYKLVTLDSKGNRVSVSSAKKAAALAPAKPTSISQNINGITLKWSKASGADSYNIYRSTSKNGSYKYVCSAVGAGTTSWTDRSVAAGRTYYYKVRPYKRINGTVYYANWTSPAGLTMKSSVKSFMVKAQSKSAIKISWAKTTNAKSYDIYVSTNGKSYSKLKNCSASLTSTTHSGLKAGKTYYYKIAAYDKNNKVLAVSDGKKTATLSK